MNSDLLKQITTAPAPADVQTDLPPTNVPEVLTTPTAPPPTVLPRLVDESELLSEPAESPAVETPAQPPQPAQPDPQPVKLGRKPGSKNRPKSPSFEDVTQVALVNYEEMSCALFDMSTGVLANTFGPEWLPGSPDERKNVCTCLEVYLRSKQAKDIPPGLMLTIVLVAYSAPRLQAPSTKEKLKPAIAWGWNKFKSFFSRKKHFTPPTIAPAP